VGDRVHAICLPTRPPRYHRRLVFVRGPRASSLWLQSQRTPNVLIPTAARHWPAPCQPAFPIHAHAGLHMPTSGTRGYKLSPQSVPRRGIRLECWPGVGVGECKCMCTDGDPPCFPPHGLPLRASHHVSRSRFFYPIQQLCLRPLNADDFYGLAHGFFLHLWRARGWDSLSWVRRRAHLAIARGSNHALSLFVHRGPTRPMGTAVMFIYPSLWLAYLHICRCINLDRDVIISTFNSLCVLCVSSPT
jgi:hypothetical protein